MKKPDRPNEFGWVLAFLFPKKGKPIAPKSGPAPVSVPPPALHTAQPPATSAPVSIPPVMPATPPPAAKAPVSFPPPAPVTPPPAAKTPVSFPPPPAPLPVSKAPAATAAGKFQPAKLLPAFWTVTGALSLIVNLILIVTLVILAQQLFELKRLVGGHVLNGLYTNFQKMDEAHIQSNIKVQDNIPINFTLPISQDTVVTLTEPTYITNVMINLNSGGLTINSPANITLPAGTNLPVHLQLDVPVNVQVPITLNVPVDIPLNQTQLHEPFVGLQNVIGPFNSMLDPALTAPSQVPACSWPIINWFCDSFFIR